MYNCITRIESDSHSKCMLDVDWFMANNILPMVNWSISIEWETTALDTISEKANLVLSQQITRRALKYNAKMVAGY